MGLLIGMGAIVLLMAWALGKATMKVDGYGCVTVLALVVSVLASLVLLAAFTAYDLGWG